MKIAIKCILNNNVFELNLFVRWAKRKTSVIETVKKVKVCSNFAQFPVRWTAQSALPFTHLQTCSFQSQLDFSGKHSATLQLLCKD